MFNLYREFKANQQIFGVLEASKALTEGIFDELPIVLIMLDDEAKILKINKVGQKVFGTDEPSVLGKKVFGILPEESATTVEKFYRSIDDGVCERISFENRIDIDGDELYFHWQICAVYSDKKGHPKVHVLIGNDTTEARAALEKVVEFSKDLEVASAVQNLLLPKEMSFTKDFYNLAGYYEPAANVGGDLWWFSDQSDTRCFNIVADVMGHGAGSAMVTAVMGGTLDSLITKYEKDDSFDVEAYLNDVHSVLKKICLGKYAICLCAISFEKHQDTVDIYCMGFPPLLLLPKDEPKKAIVIRGCPLGLEGDTFFVAHKQVPFKPGDRLISVTDGCYEFAVGEKRQLGRGKLFKIFDDLRKEEPKQVCDIVSKKLKDLRGVDYAEDDITFVVIDRK